MTAGLWSETKPHTVKVGKMECNITLKHIGGPKDVFRFKSMQNAWRSTCTKAEKDARLKIMEEYKGDTDEAMRDILGDVKEPTMSWAIQVWLDQQQEWLDLYSKRLEDIITAGTVEGVEAMDALVNAGGPAMLIQAELDIVRFHIVDAKQGEG